ncbi:hypothetical protein N5T90_05555 [Aliarcobacter cryaerophilus]|jgi:hypothetical protein|uniref:hypothetical protein n=1 Tax=Aliarcobacter TaxID=2321111 RepID=UPI00112F758E|nr:MULTISPECIES: hypothetical protein [Aliarcobacter]MCT7444446.1 hypothetical protein [Aliarcobacter cryaerophilus]MCT7468315.1 hypothetical protein [Aliarcobacter cryaerophilus]MCT7470331.1 hypothetical protein [Aliarcobacter cryaerophilus]MCT7479114.1 hypothetical protein [Aliarcobacter cryaerophilus]MCT7573134.1 hypothetical protein [Aliarcobacter butzleri]
MSNYNQIFQEDLVFFENMNLSYALYESIDLMIEDLSGIFIVSNDEINPQDLTFRLMGTYIKKKEEKTKKKQLYSLGIKDIRKKNLEEITKIRKEFNKLVLVFNQLKHFRAIDDVEVAMKGIR